MSDKIKELVNKVVLTGKLAEIEVTEGKNKDKIPYISVKGAIQFGDSKTLTKRFEKYVQESNNDGKESKVYPKVQEFVKKAKSIAKVGFEEATEVSIQGSFATNDYVNAEEKLIESLKIDASFFNDAEGEYKGTADIEGYIQSITPEVKGEEQTETGRLRVTMLTTDFFGNLVPVKNIVVPAELKEDFEAGYEVGQTAKLYIDFAMNKAEAKPKKTGGIGAQRETEGKSYVEMIVTGADAPYDEDDDNAVSKKAIKIALAERKAKLDEIEKKGYQGSKGKSISNASQNKGKNKPSPVTDEDIPF